MTPEHYDLDLGDGHWADWIGGWDGARPFGVTVHHLTADGQMCASAAIWDRHGDPTKQWKLVGEADAALTITPSLQCLRCGDHGFIRSGKWVRA